MAVEIDTRSFATLAEARAHAGVGEEEGDLLPLLAIALNTAAAGMEAYCGRVLRQRAIDQMIDGDGSAVAFVPEWPVARDPVPVVYSDAGGDFNTSTMLSVWPWTGAHRDYDLMVDDETGEMTRTSGGWPRGRKTIRVVATVGYDPDEAHDLKRAQLEIAHALFEATGRDPAVTSETILGISRTFIGGRNDAEASFVAMPPFARRVLDMHRRPAFLS
jgi:hypothetical protein